MLSNTLSFSVKFKTSSDTELLTLYLYSDDEYTIESGGLDGKRGWATLVAPCEIRNQVKIR